MSTFLQIGQDVYRDSGTGAASDLTTMIGQTGRNAQVVASTAEAWRQIQQESKSWNWMRAEWGPFALTSGTDAYTPTTIGLTRFKRWVLDEPKITIYDNDIGVSDEGELTYIDWPLFQRHFLRGSQTNNRPTHYTVRPRDNALLFGPKPDDSYRVQGDYIKSVQTLSANADEPECPSEHHALVKWKALLLLNEFDEALFSRNVCEMQYRTGLGALKRDCLPAISDGSAPIA